MKESNLYLINDQGETYYVVANDYQAAINRWSEGNEEKSEPDHVSLVADHNHLLVM